MDGEPIAAPRNAPLELKLRIMLRNWSYPEFREILYREAREDKGHNYSGVYKRLYAYLRALELRRQGLSYNRVRSTVLKEIGYALSRLGLSYWLRGLRTPLGNIAVFDVRRREVGLVMGLILSDGHERRYYNRGHVNDRREQFSNRDESILKEFREACHRLKLTIYEELAPTELGGKCWRLKTSSTLLYLLLKRFDEFIVKAPSDVQWHFLRGLWLGDGCIKRCELYNTDLRIIKTASTLLATHQVEFTVEGPYNPEPPGKRPKYVVYIKSHSRKRFFKLAGFAESPPRPSQRINFGHCR